MGKNSGKNLVFISHFIIEFPLREEVYAVLVQTASGIDSSGDLLFRHFFATLSNIK